MPETADPFGFNASVPDPIRVYDYLLGGKDNFAADRDMAEALEEQCPGLRRVVRAHRDFALKAAGWAASRGIRQFIQAATGMPQRPYIAEAVREHEPSAVVAYVAADPVVLSHVAALKCTGPGLAAVEGDLRDPAGVLAAVAAARQDRRPVFDFGEPVCVLLPGALSVLPGGEARRVAAGFTGPLVPGSAAVICAAHFRDAGAAAKAIAVYSPCSPWHDHDAGAVASFFAGLEAPDGGRVRAADVETWPMASPGEGKAMVVLGGVGVKP